jgi:hypothetical protein
MPSIILVELGFVIYGSAPRNISMLKGEVIPVTRSRREVLIGTFYICQTISPLL